MSEIFNKASENQTLDIDISNELSEKLNVPKELDSNLSVNNSGYSNRTSKSKNQKKNINNNEDDFNWINEYRKTLIGNPLITEHYHDSEIKNAHTMLIWSMTLLSIIIVGTIVLCAVCVLQKKTTEAIISGTVGTIISGIVGFITDAFNKTLESKKLYFNEEIEMEKINNMILLIHTISNNKLRDSVVEDVVRKYFDVLHNIDKND